jgi:predicted metal-dependent enzyme (double-stranded beta helix superfamily)
MSERLQCFLRDVERAVHVADDEAKLLKEVEIAMRALVASDDWLPAEFALPHPVYYQQYLLHRDPQGRFSVVSFVWGPGQQTPVHDHTVWGVIGMLRGAEVAQGYRVTPKGLLPDGEASRLEPGDVAAVSPAIGDVHRVVNAYDDRVSVSIHVYGADIGRTLRHVFDPATGARKEFVSGYANAEDVA